MPGLFLITLNYDRSATKSNVPEASGTWEYVHGEARVTWSDGWNDIIRCTPEGELKKRFDLSDPSYVPESFGSGKSFTW